MSSRYFGALLTWPLTIDTNRGPEVGLNRHLPLLLSVISCA